MDIFVYLIAMPSLHYYHSTDNGHFDIYITSYEPCTVTTHLPWSDVMTHEMDIETLRMTYLLTSDQVESMLTSGARVQSSRAVTIQVSIGKTYNTLELAYAALPLTRHSTSYFLASYTSRANKYKQLFIVGTDDQAAEVTVYRYSGGEAGVVMQFTVDARMMKHIVMENNSVDITGYQLVSSAPVAVYSGHQCVNIPVTELYCDPMIQQLLHVDVLGRDYVLGPINGRAMEVGFTVRVIKTTEDTDVMIEHVERLTVISTEYHGLDGQCNGERLSDTTTVVRRSDCIMGRPNIGDFIEVKNNAALLPVAIHCSDPCLVIQYNHGGNMDRSKSDPFMMLAVPIASEANIAKFTTFEMLAKGERLQHVNYVNIISKVADFDDIILDGQLLDSIDTVVLRPEFGDVSIATMRLPPGDHTIKHQNRTTPFWVQLYGHGDKNNPKFGGKTGYGMPIGRSLMGAISATTNSTISSTIQPTSNTSPTTSNTTPSTTTTTPTTTTATHTTITTTPTTPTTTTTTPTTATTTPTTTTTTPTTTTANPSTSTREPNHATTTFTATYTARPTVLTTIVTVVHDNFGMSTTVIVIVVLVILLVNVIIILIVVLIKKRKKRRLPHVPHMHYSNRPAVEQHLYEDIPGPQPAAMGVINRDPPNGDAYYYDIPTYAEAMMDTPQNSDDYLKPISTIGAATNNPAEPEYDEVVHAQNEQNERCDEAPRGSGEQYQSMTGYKYEPLRSGAGDKKKGDYERYSKY